MSLFKKPDLQAEIQMNEGLAYVDISGDVSSVNLIKLAIYYLGRYFYICDDRQFLPMKSILEQYSNEEKLDYPAFNKLMDSIEKMVYETFTEGERKALAGYIGARHSLPFIPDKEKLDKIQFRYIYKMFFAKNHIRTNLKMSLLLDKQILPRSVAFILFFVSEKLTPAEQKKLKEAIQVFLKEFGDLRKGAKLIPEQHPQTIATENL